MTHSILQTLVGDATPAHEHRPWPRWRVSAERWSQLGESLANGDLTLTGLWGDGGTVHMGLADAAGAPLGVVSLTCAGGRFPSIARVHAPAMRLERTVRDLWGLIPDGLPDMRPWLDHGRWDGRSPLAAATTPPSGPAAYAFLAAEGEGLHQIPVGPVHAGIIEPGHFRFTANGEAVVRLEARLGYTHKGIESLLHGASLERAAQLAARVSGDSTIAYSWAFAQAVEAAAFPFVHPPRALHLRALMAELERLANHFGDIGAICNDASFTVMHIHCGVLREHVLRASLACFGHRLMMDRVVPGGVTTDLSGTGVEQLRELIALIRQRFPELVELYDNTASLQDRTMGTGILSAALVRQFGAGGFIGRASGRAFDARRAVAYPPYDELQFEVPVREEGDVDARVWIRIDEVGQSLAIIEHLLEQMPAGAIREPLAHSAVDGGEGMALIEGFRGDVLAWVRLGPRGMIDRCHLRDPSWFQWPLLEAAIDGNIVADFPLCNKSFNCSYSGHDL